VLPVVAPPETRPHRLFLIGSVYGGKFGAAVKGSSADADPQLYDRVDFGATPTLQYIFTGERVVLTSATGGTVLRYAPGHYSARRIFESLRLTTPLTEHTDLAVHGVATYSPFYSFDLAVDPEDQDAADVVPPETLQIIAMRKNLNVDAGATWRYRLAPRSTLSIDGGVTQTAFFGEGTDLLSPHGGIGFTRQLSPNASLQLGYGYREFRYDSGSVRDLREHDIRAGVGYSRPLPFRRPTRIGFSVGSGTAQTANRLRFDITGQAFLTRELSRAWFAVASYRRGLDVRPGLNQPLFLFGDTAAVTLSGLLSSRLGVRTTASYVRGTSLLDQFQQHSSWWSSSTVLSARLLGPVAAFGEGTFTSQRLSSQLGPIVGLPTRVDRYSVTAGIMMVIPVLR
jgi:hypothetical protein